MDKLLILYAIYNFVVVILCDHWSRREQLIKIENELMVGSDIKIQGIEKCVNKTLMSLKLRELDRGLDYPDEYYPSTNFLKTVKYIESSEVYSFIKDIPKGAALHIHDVAMASPEYLYELTFTENLYICKTKKGKLLLNFFLFHVDNRCDWKLLEDIRGSEAFENMLREQLSMDTPAYKKQLSNKMAWTELLGTYATIEGLITYKPIYTSYLKEVLSKMYEDNVMYVELRTTLAPVYDLDGNNYRPTDVATILKDTLADFRCVHNDFMGGKIIYAPIRMADQSWMDYYIQIVDQLNAQHSDFVAGFDLTGQEDLSYPLSRFISSFKEMKSKVNFFFSAGETNWIGANADINLFDAVLLNPTRIGHAFTLFGHPELLKIVKKNDIAIEICPISNQMMMLVSDLRNHPGKYLISHGYPIVVSSDNPGFWGARILSHDWYMVFMAMADRKADLRLLMQLAINSIKYSTIDDKEGALDLWRKKWDSYMKNMKQWCIDHEKDERKNEPTTQSLQIPKTEKEKYNSGSWITEDENEPTVKIWDITTRPRRWPTTLPEISDQSTSTLSTLLTTLTPRSETTDSTLSSASTLTKATSESPLTFTTITAGKAITETKLLIPESTIEQTEPSVQTEPPVKTEPPVQTEPEETSTQTETVDELNSDMLFSTTQITSTEATSVRTQKDTDQTSTLNTMIPTAKNDLGTSIRVRELYLLTDPFDTLNTTMNDVTETAVITIVTKEASTEDLTEALTELTEMTTPVASSVEEATDFTESDISSDITDTNSVTECSDYEDTNDSVESTTAVTATDDCTEYVDDEEQPDKNATDVDERGMTKPSEYLSTSTANQTVTLTGTKSINTSTAGTTAGISNASRIAVSSSVSVGPTAVSVEQKSILTDSHSPVDTATINFSLESTITGEGIPTVVITDDNSETAEDTNAVTQDQDGRNTKETDQNTAATKSQNTIATDDQNTAAEGQNTAAEGQNTATEGENTATGQNTAAEGQNTAAEDQNTAVEGQNTAAEGQNTAAEGQNTASEGENSATGQNTAAESQNTVVETPNTATEGQNSAAGENTAAGSQNTAAGSQNTAIEGQNSATEGKNSAAKDQNSAGTSQNINTTSPAA